MITTELQNMVATYVAESVTEIIVNDTYSITEFTQKENINGIATISFILTESDAETVDKLTVKAGDKVISNSTLFLKRDGEVQFSYRLEVLLSDRTSR